MFTMEQVLDTISGKVTKLCSSLSSRKWKSYWNRTWLGGNSNTEYQPGDGLLHYALLNLPLSWALVSEKEWHDQHLVAPLHAQTSCAVLVSSLPETKTKNTYQNIIWWLPCPNANLTQIYISEYFLLH